jgi:hypothetical protein
MRILLSLLLLFVRPPDEYTRACTDPAGEVVYLVQSPDDCEPADKLVCDFGDFDVGTKVCCSWELDDCSLVDPPGECLATEVQVCTA